MITSTRVIYNLVFVQGRIFHARRTLFTIRIAMYRSTIMILEIFFCNFFFFTTDNIRLETTKNSPSRDYIVQNVIYRIKYTVYHTHAHYYRDMIKMIFLV